MPKLKFAKALSLFICLFAVAALKVSAAEISVSKDSKPGGLLQADRSPEPSLVPASNEGELAIKGFQKPPGFKIDLYAAEPLLGNAVSFCFDEKGRIYTSETYRYRTSVLDIRAYMHMLDADIACRTIEDREAMCKKFFGAQAADLAIETEVIRLLEDRSGSGKADSSTIYAQGFNSLLDGIASGVIARKGKVWFTDIPNLWQLQDTKGDGKADVRQILSRGYGVHFSLTGHDMHGLIFGPDGRLYFSIGDRGANVKTQEGKQLNYPDQGSVFRCNPDGSELEVYATGVRNPQELAFDKYGNLFTGDNDFDHGDHERWVYVVEGGDSGWRIGYQFPPLGYDLVPWMLEKIWWPHFDGQAAYIVPPVANIGDGPSGLVYNYGGTGLPAKFDEHFFLCHFKGAPNRSGIETYKIKPKGATFEMVVDEPFIWGTQATDVDIGPDGAIYWADWGSGWERNKKGRIYRAYDVEAMKNPIVAETKKLIGEGMEKRTSEELAGLLGHRDQRVRREAQFELADRGAASIKTLVAVARKNESQLARIHAIWGLGQIGRHDVSALTPLVPLLKDVDDEVRAQAVKTLADDRYPKAGGVFTKLLKDPSARVRFFAATGLGRIAYKEGAHDVLAMLRENQDQDQYLRHAGVMALVGMNDSKTLLTAAKDSSSSVRMASLLAMRRLGRPEIAQFLADSDPLIVVEAARAINDAPINDALPQLAELIHKPTASLPLMLRVINANFRTGSAEAAKALADYAVLNDTPEANRAKTLREEASGKDAKAKAQEAGHFEHLRAEALLALVNWAEPPARDRIVGLYRPLAERKSKPATDALRPVLAQILRTAPDSVRVAAIDAAMQLKIRDVAPVLAELVPDTKLTPATRAAALKALDTFEYSRLAEVVKAAVTDKSEIVRTEANRVQAKLNPGDATTPLANVLQHGTVRERQGAFATLATVPGAKADAMISSWLDKLLAGQADKEIQFDLLQAAAKRKTPAIQEQLAKYEAARPKNDNLARFREILYGGNAEAGKTVFYEKPEASCFRCHQIKGEGGEVGPHLDGVATRQTREYILESIIDPNAKIAPGFESWTVTMKNGMSYAGILKSENDQEIVLNSPEDGLLKLKKAEIKSRDKGLSGMPPGMGEILPKEDIRNLVEFISTLK